MSQELRTKILLLLEQHARTGSNEYVSDTDLANQIGVTVEEVQRQLDILESEDLIQSANTFGGNNAIISPKGALAVEQMLAQAQQPKKNPIGFQPP